MCSLGIVRPRRAKGALDARVLVTVPEPVHAAAVAHEPQPLTEINGAGEKGKEGKRYREPSPSSSSSSPSSSSNLGAITSRSLTSVKAERRSGHFDAKEKAEEKEKDSEEKEEKKGIIHLTSQPQPERKQEEQSPALNALSPLDPAVMDLETYVSSLEERALTLMRRNTGNTGNTGEHSLAAAEGRAAVAAAAALLDAGIAHLLTLGMHLHVDTAALRHLLAKCCIALEQPVRAEILLRDVLEVYYEACGGATSSDLYTAQALEDLHQALAAQGKQKEARCAMARMAEINKVLDPSFLTPVAIRKLAAVESTDANVVRSADDTSTAGVAAAAKPLPLDLDALERRLLGSLTSSPPPRKSKSGSEMLMRTEATLAVKERQQTSVADAAASGNENVKSLSAPAAALRTLSGNKSSSKSTLPLRGPPPPPGKSAGIIWAGAGTGAGADAAPSNYSSFGSNSPPRNATAGASALKHRQPTAFVR
jgi:hypothetical protein